MKRTFTIILIIIGISFSTVVHADDINLQDEVIYNIIIDRFNNGDQSLSDHVQVDDPYNYHGGDFVGIMKKLDDLQALGFTTIVLSPVMDNASTGFHGYWVEDFFNLNKNYGTEEEFKQLVDEAHDRGMKVGVELVFNYAALTNPLVTDAETKHWFQEKTFTPSENEESLFWFQDVVQFDQQNESVQEYLLDVTAYWMDEIDVDGFKLHAADQADELFLETLTTFIKEKDPNYFLLANVLDVESNVEWLQEMDTIDAVENHQMFETLIDVFLEVSTPIEELFDQWQNIGHEKDLIFTETKDTARFANAVALNDRNALTTWTLALTYLYTTPGIPYMYQGNELQMFGLEFPETQQMMRFNSTEPDLEEFHNKLSMMLAEYPVLTTGEFAQEGASGGLSVFSRTLDNETMYIAINNDESMQEVRLTDIPEDKQLRGLFEDEIVRGNQAGEFILTIPRESVDIYVVQDNVGINWLYIAFVATVFIIFLTAIFYLSRKQKQREQQNE